MAAYAELLSRSATAERALSNCRAFLLRGLNEINGELVWTDQPDQGPPYLGAYGASCAALALLAAGESKDSALIRRLLDYLARRQLESGGWTIRNAQPMGLTTACAFAVMAYGESGIQTPEERKAVERGAAWLLATRRSNGWPYFEGGSEVSVVATALATRALRSVEPFLPATGRDAINASCRSLERAIDEQGGWCGRGDARIGSAGSVATTAVVVNTLLCCGYNSFSNAVAPGTQWLREQTDLAHDNGDSFYVHLPTGQSAAVNYVHFTPAIVLQALLRADGDNLSDTAALRALDIVLSSQEKTGSWTSPLAPKQTPTWLLMDGALALSAFVQEIISASRSLKFTERLGTLQESVSRVDAQLTTLTDKLGEFDRELLVVLRIARGLRRVGRWCRRVVPFALVAIVALGYLIVRQRSPLGQNSDALGVAATVILTLIAIWDARRQATRSKQD